MRNLEQKSAYGKKLRIGDESMESGVVGSSGKICKGFAPG